MNPRVSRSSALASKATGFPIAKIAAKLAVGYTLDEIPNDITEKTPASFEPTLDYVVVKVPRFAFEKFPGADATLTTTMKSVGEAMAIGRNLHRGAAEGAALAGEEGQRSSTWRRASPASKADAAGEPAASHTTAGSTPSCRPSGPAPPPRSVFEATKIDPWFLDQLFADQRDRRRSCARRRELDRRAAAEAKRHGFSDAQIAEHPRRCARTSSARCGTRWASAPSTRPSTPAPPSSPPRRPYLYSSYDEETEVAPRDQARRSSSSARGPNRIGQGIEFDYSCVHASFALREAGYETVMVNCNPETVSTDYDTSDRLYFEPLTLEDVLEVVHAEQQTGPVAGVIVQLGGQTPLGLAQALKDAGVPIVGTSPEAIHLAEDRGAFGRVLAEAGLPAPKHGTATTFERGQGDRRRDRLPGPGPPLLRARRPRHGDRLRRAPRCAVVHRQRPRELSPDHPVLVDRFLDDAIEIDVDALYDGEELYLGGVMEHIEEAGIHSGDSACALPPITLGGYDIKRLRASTEAIAAGVGVRGLINIQFAHGRRHPLRPGGQPARLPHGALRLQGHRGAAGQGRGPHLAGRHHRRAARRGPAPGRRATAATLPLDAPISVKEAVLPLTRFRDVQGRGVDTVLGPEMRSTGEVMGIDSVFGTAYAKSQAAAYGALPTKGRAFVSVANRDKRSMIFPVKRAGRPGLRDARHRGHRRGAAPQRHPRHSRAQAERGRRTRTASRRSCSCIHDGEVDLIVNTPFGSPGQSGPRSTATRSAPPPCCAASPASPPSRRSPRRSRASRRIIRGDVGVRSLQEHAERLRVLRERVRSERRRCWREVRRDSPYSGTGDGHGADDAPRRRLPCADAGGARASPSASGRATSWRVAVGGGPARPCWRRAFSVHDVKPDYGGTVEFVFTVRGPGTAWLAERRAARHRGPGRPARPPVPAAARPGELRAGRRRVRHGDAVPARRRAAAARLPGRLRARRASSDRVFGARGARRWATPPR